MNKHNLLILSLTLSAPLVAQDIQIIGTIEKPVTLQPTKLFKNQSDQQKIKFLKMQLSDLAKQAISNRAQNQINKTRPLITASNPLSRVELGMNQVPVLNQGNFGTCVAFASTAAVDAVLNKGNYISQLCQLQLGMTLEQSGYYPSGWDGSYGLWTLNQMLQFGVVSMDKQKSFGCGGLTEYPKNDLPTEDRAMSLDQFHQLSEDLKTVAFTSLLDIFQAGLQETDTDKTINDIKRALKEKDRVVFGVLLLDFDKGLMGAVGTNKSKYDTWVMTPEIARDLELDPEFGGHEMIITGFDDNAIAMDNQGRQYKGLFTLRNSWGNQLGDRGDFYMSYDFFKVLVMEAIRIRSIPFN